MDQNKSYSQVLEELAEDLDKLKDKFETLTSYEDFSQIVYQFGLFHFYIACDNEDIIKQVGLISIQSARQMKALKRLKNEFEGYMNGK